MKRENPDFPPFVCCFLQLYPTIRMASGRNQPLGAVIIRAIKRRSVYMWFNTDMWFLAGAFRWFPQRCRPNYSLDRNLFELFHLFGFSRPPGLELGSGVDTVQFISAGKKNVQLNFHSNLNRNFDHFLSLSLSLEFFFCCCSVFCCCLLSKWVNKWMRGADWKREQKQLTSPISTCSNAPRNSW